MTETKNIAIAFKKVSKRYRLYRSDKHRFAGIFSNRVPFKEVYANRDLSFTIKSGESVAVMGKNAVRFGASGPRKYRSSKPKSSISQI